MGISNIIGLFNQDTANIYEFYKTKAKIDNKQSDVRYANYAISAVPLSLGQHLSALFHALKANTTAPYGGTSLSQATITEALSNEDLEQGEVQNHHMQGQVVNNYRQLMQGGAQLVSSESQVDGGVVPQTTSPPVKHYAVHPEETLRLEMTSPAHRESLVTYFDEYGIDALARLFKSGETVESLRLKLNQRLSESVNTEVSAQVWNEMAVTELVSALFHALKANTTAPYGGTSLSQATITEALSNEDLEQGEVQNHHMQGQVVNNYRQLMQGGAQLVSSESQVDGGVVPQTTSPPVKHYAVHPEETLRLEMTSPAHRESLVTYFDEYGIDALARLFKSGETVESLRLKLNQRLSESVNTEVSAQVWNEMAVTELVSALEVHGLLDRKVSRERPLRSDAEIRANEMQIRNRRFAPPSQRGEDSLKAHRARMLESTHHDNLREGASIMKNLLHCSLTWDELGLLIPSSNAYKLQALKDLSEDFGTDIQTFLQSGRPPISYQQWLKLPVQEKLEFAVDVSSFVEESEDELYTSMSSLNDESVDDPIYEEIGPALDAVFTQYRHEEWMRDTAFGNGSFLNDLPDENDGIDGRDKWS